VFIVKEITEASASVGLLLATAVSMNSRIHHFLPECIAINQSALRDEL